MPSDKEVPLFVMDMLREFWPSFREWHKKLVEVGKDRAMPAPYILLHDIADLEERIAGDAGLRPDVKP